MPIQLASMSRRDIVGLIDAFGLTTGAILGPASDRCDFASLCLEHSQLRMLHLFDRWRISYSAYGEPECVLKMSKYPGRTSICKLSISDATDYVVQEGLSFDFIYSEAPIQNVPSVWYTKPVATGIVAGSGIRRDKNTKEKWKPKHSNIMDDVAKLGDKLDRTVYTTGGWALSWWFVA